MINPIAVNRSLGKVGVYLKNQGQTLAGEIRSIKQ